MKIYRETKDGLEKLVVDGEGDIILCRGPYSLEIRDFREIPLEVRNWNFYTAPPTLLKRVKLLYDILIVWLWRARSVRPSIIDEPDSVEFKA